MSLTKAIVLAVESSSANRSTQSKRRKVEKLLVSCVYLCNRSGQLQVQKNRPRKNARISYADSKKVGCTAKLWVTCKESNPDWVTIMYNVKHKNHQPGSLEDVRHLPKSKELIAAIVKRLSEGQTVRAVRDYFRRFPITGDKMSRDSYVITNDVYQEYVKLQYETSKKNEDEHVSAKQWVDELKGMFI